MAEEESWNLEFGSNCSVAAHIPFQQCAELPGYRTGNPVPDGVIIESYDRTDESRGANQHQLASRVGFFNGVGLFAE